MSGEPEPRRSVRATKGQHTKVFEALENGPEPTKRRQGTKKGKKQAQSSQQEEDDEIIRCICGATSQDDDDANEPWIACDECGAWQHNVCMGMSVFTEDLPNKYFCEQCKPEDHKETLAATEKGEKPWETRRHDYEAEKKKGKKGKKGKAKRASDPKERSSPAASSNKVKASPTPEVKKEEPVPEPPSKGKRKSRDHSQGAQPNKMRKVSETRAVPALPEYTPPADLVESIDKLQNPRKGAAQGLKKSLDAALDLAVKGRLYTIPQGSNKKTITERHAIEIERAVHDSHPNTAAASAQARALVFNLKANVELAARVLNRTLTPTALATLTSDDMATKELQRETAEMKARAEKQSIMITEEGPRMRRTHKGEELVETDNFAPPTTEALAAAPVRRQSVGEATGEAGKPGNQGSTSMSHAESPANVGSGPLRVDTQGTQQQPRQSVDIDKVFSSVRSPSASHQRRPSAPSRPAGPGVDPDVDRLLQDDGTDSPPYSPTEHIDPDIVWQGNLNMTSVGDFSVIARHVGGADLSKLRGIPWKNLIPPVLTVAGRIPEEKAIPYLCSLRYNNQVDLVITSLAPANSGDSKAKADYLSVIDYFQSKRRYGVVGERKLGNVRDTYLVPVPAGDGPIPEPMQNIGDHLIPPNRAQPMLLMVFVVRAESQAPISLDQQASEIQQATPSGSQTSTPMPDHRQSIAQPSWSPATPHQATFPNSAPPPHQSHTPIPPPVIPGQPAPPMPPRQTPVPTQSSQEIEAIEALRRAQAEGERQARQVLGPLFTSPTVTFLLPHASRMKEGEWKAVKRCIEKDPRAREDLQYLSKLLTEEGNTHKHNGNGQSGPQIQGQMTTASPGVSQSTLAAAAATATTAAAQVNVPAPAGPAQAPQPSS